MTKVLWFFLLFIYTAADSNFYVSNNSSLTINCGTTLEQACGTIQAGINVACGSNVTENSSVTLWVGPGNYSIEASIQIDCSIDLRFEYILLYTIDEE